MDGRRGRWRVVVLATVLAALALLGFDGHPASADAAGGGAKDGAAVVADVVETKAPALTGADAAQRGLARTVRPVPLPSQERLVAVSVAVVLALGAWVLVRGDGWGARPAAAAPLATRRGPPAPV